MATAPRTAPESEITFYESRRAFPTIRSNENPELVISSTTADGGCHWEFTVEEHRDHRGGLIGTRVQMFHDSWAALGEIPEFFAVLHSLASPDRPITLNHIIGVCQELGYRDRTPEFAERHQHHFSCACGALHAEATQ